jgi:NAD(P)-dependent dehydrogenase (short-subunit alcohol dehydrogenase family)
VDAFSRTRKRGPPVEATLNHPFPAQVWHGGDFEAVDERAFDRVVGVNLKGTFFAVQAAVPHMRDRGGAVVIIGSDQSLVGKPEQHPVWKSNLQPDFNVRVCDRFDARLSAVLRELDESNRSIQKSAESTSI